MTPKGYGIDINTIGDLVTHPNEEAIFSCEEFELRRVDANAVEDYASKIVDRDSTIFIEDNVVYILSGPKKQSGVARFDIVDSTTDVREKYWGEIETIVSRDYAGKRIYCAAGKHSSLEYHCKKTEGYYIHSGTIFLRVRAGRAEDKFLKLKAGDAILIPPGLMHQRGSKDGGVILEISTSDDDADSFLVEDGQKTPMPGLLTE